MVESYGPYNIFLKMNRAEMNNNVKRFKLKRSTRQKFHILEMLEPW